MNTAKFDSFDWNKFANKNIVLVDPDGDEFEVSEFASGSVKDEIFDIMKHGINNTFDGRFEEGKTKIHEMENGEIIVTWCIPFEIWPLSFKIIEK